MEESLRFSSDNGNSLLGVVWLSGKHMVGVVAYIVDSTGSWLASIDAVGCEACDAEIAMQEIVGWGSVLEKNQAAAFFPYLHPDKYRGGQCQSQALITGIEAHQ